MIFGNLDNEFKVTTEKIKDFKQILSYDFGSLYKKNNISLAHISPEELQTLQTYVNTLGVAENRTASYNDILKDSSDLVKRQATNFTSLYESYRRGEISLNQYQTATQNLALTQKTAAATSKALSLALNTIVNVGTMVLINLAIQGISKLADKLIVTKEELAEMRQETLNSLDSLKQGIESLSDRNQEVEQLLSNYKELVSSTNDTSEVKDQLIEIQGQLIDKFGEEAENLDLLNDKYDTTIEKIKSLSDAEETEWRRQHAAEIKRAEDIRNLNVSADTLAKQSEYTGQSGETRALYKPTSSVTPNKDLVTELYLIEDINRNARWAAESIDGILASKMSFWDNNDAIILTGTIEEARQQLGLLIDTYKQADDADAETLDVLTTRYNELGKAIEDVNTWASQDKLTESFTDTSNAIGTIATTAVSQLAEINAEADNISAKWFENFGEMQKGSLKTIDTIKAALQTIASGDLLSSDDFWALAEIDTDKVLSGAQLINNQFKLSEEQLIQLKDAYIQKQIDAIKAENADLAIKKQQTDELIRQAELEVQAIGRRGLSNAAYREEYEKANEQLNQTKQSSKEYGDSIARNNLLIQQLNSSLGNTVDKQKAATELAKKAQDDVNNYAKAMTTAVQNVIDGLNDEKEQLESEKELLNDQLDIFNEQKDAVEEIIDQYKSIIDVVQDVNEAEIDALEARQEAEEKAIQSKIDSLKEQHEQQEEGNSLSEKELDLRKKLADLEKAKNTKVKTYSEERGWHFDVDREVVANAQAEAVEAQKVYDKAVADKDYNDQIKALEAEKKAVTDSYQLQIDAQKTYFEQWQEIVNEQSKAESEQLAEQILGSKWREKIKSKDTEILDRYRSDFRLYNSQLNNLVNNEIASLQKSIKAKDEEIEAKSKQIKSWQDYKNQVQDTIDTISGKYDEYTQLLNNINLTEADSYTTRENNLRNFATEFESLIDDLHGYQSQVDDINISVNISTDKARDDMAQFIEDYKEAVESMSQALEESSTGYGVVNSDWDARLAEAANRMKHGYATGGTVDYTGVAMVHGSKTSAETVFNAAQSKELYNMVKSGTFANVVADKAYAGLTSAMSKINNATNSDNRIININGMVIKADNPKQFHDQFMQEIGQYWNVKLTESYVK